MTLTKKILIGISSIIILFVGFMFWLFFEIANENKGDEIFYNIEIPEKLKFEKPILFLSNRQIDSLRNLKVEQEKILVIGNGYSGYDFYMWHKPSEKGELFIKAYELTKNIQLSEEIMKEEKTIVEDLIRAAHNNAKSQLKSKTTEEISKATGDFGIPGFKWPL